MRRALAALALLLITSAAFAQEKPEHPIDKALGVCIEKDPSTAGLTECTTRAYQSWDRELNKNYGELMRKLKAPQKEALKAAQLEWIKQRDAEFKFIDSVFDTLEGTMYISMRIESRTELVKTRALLLKSYYDLVADADAP